MVEDVYLHKHMLSDYDAYEDQREKGVNPQGMIYLLNPHTQNKKTKTVFPQKIIITKLFSFSLPFVGMSNSLGFHEPSFVPEESGTSPSLSDVS